MSIASAAPARAGRSGKAFTIATKSDVKYVDAIEKLIGQKIEWHDGDLSTVVASESEDEAPRRGRGAPRRAGRKDEGERKRGGRERSDRHADKPARSQEAADVEAVAAEAPVEKRDRKDAIRTDNAERKAKPERAEQPRRDDRHERPRRDDRNGRPDRTEQNRRQREQDDDGTIGFGDDMPAFMRVSAKV